MSIGRARTAISPRRPDILIKHVHSITQQTRNLLPALPLHSRLRSCAMYPHYRPDAHSRPHVPWRVLPSNGPLRSHGPSWHQPHTIPSSSHASIPYPPSYYAQPSTSLPAPLPHDILGSSDELRLGPVNSAAKKRKLVKDSRSEDDIEAVARRLYSKLLAVPRFRSYREGDRKKGPSAKTIWPDPVEFTLFRGSIDGLRCVQTKLD